MDKESMDKMQELIGKLQKNLSLFTILARDIRYSNFEEVRALKTTHDCYKEIAEQIMHMLDRQSELARGLPGERE